MKFSGKSCENFQKLGIKKRQEKFLENFAEFLKKFQSASFIKTTAFYRAEYGLLSSKTWQHCVSVPFLDAIINRPSHFLQITHTFIV